MSDFMSLWSLFKDSTTLQAVLGALIGFLVMQVFQQRRTTMPNMPMDERFMPNYRGGLSPPMPGDLPFNSPGTKLQKGSKKQAQSQGQKQKNKKAGDEDVSRQKLEDKLFGMLDEDSDEDSEDAVDAVRKPKPNQDGKAKSPQEQKPTKGTFKADKSSKEAPKNELRQRRGRPQPSDEAIDNEDDEDNDAESDAGDEHSEAESDDGSVAEQSEDDEADRGMIPYSNVTYSEPEMLSRAAAFCDLLSRRRSCRQFSERPLDPELVKLLVKAAGSSPSGAHTEPWTYVCVTNELLKRRIREIVEEEEEINYARRMGAAWKADLAKLRTTWEKPYLTEAPVIVVLMRQVHGWRRGQEEKQQHYYSEMSVSISAGLFLAAVQNVGLCTLTSTPMNAGPALRRLLGRPPNEKVHLLMPLGYPARDAQVPNLTRKPLDKIMISM